MKKFIIIICIFFVTGCFSHTMHINYSCIKNDISDGRYYWSDISFLYWGYKVELVVKEGRGYAKIKDKRSLFEVEDILTLQKVGYNDCIDFFGGKYLSFIKQSDDEWILILKNPVSGKEFIGIDKRFSRT